MRAKFMRPIAMRIAMRSLPTVERHVGRSDLVFARGLPPTQRETEWAFPIERTAEVMGAMRAAIERAGLRMNFPGAVRFVKGDDIMMSPANRGGGDSAYFSTLLQGSGTEDDRVMQVIQQTMIDLGGRPHWGKENAVSSAATMRAQYGENYDTFRAMRDRLDPTGVFRNAYLDRFFPQSQRASANPERQ